MKPKAADRESVDLYRFTSLLKDRLDEGGAREHHRDDVGPRLSRRASCMNSEDNVIWRVADLLGISNRDRMRLKQSARAADHERHRGLKRSAGAGDRPESCVDAIRFSFLRDTVFDR